MFICNNCKNTFDEPAEIQDRVGEFFGEGVYEHYLICPSCREIDFDEAHYCPRCGEATSEDVFCKACQDEILTLYREVEFLIDNGTEVFVEVPK